MPKKRLQTPLSHIPSAPAECASDQPDRRLAWPEATVVIIVVVLAALLVKAGFEMREVLILLLGAALTGVVVLAARNLSFARLASIVRAAIAAA